MDTRIKLLLTLILATCSISLFTQNSWFSDEEMHFKINLPDNYQRNQFWEGDEKILAVASPNQNVIVRIRSFPATDQFTTELIQQAFEQNVINGANRLIQEEGHLNRIPARVAAYTWRYNNTNTVVGVYYLLRNGKGYIIWSVIPQDLLQQHSKEADLIINSFTLLPSASGSSSMESSATGVKPSSLGEESVVITDIKTGTQPNNSYRLANRSTAFQGSVPAIDLVFGYNGNAYGSDIIVKWFSDTHQIPVKEFHVTPPDASSGRGHSFITNQGKPWPEGDYHAEIWHRGKIVGKHSFVITEQKADVVPHQSNEMHKPDYFSLVSDDALIEHLVPNGYKVTESKKGLSVWKNDSGISMVQQLILKQEELHTFIKNQITDLKNQGATVISEDNFTQNGLQVYQYVYEYGSSLFAYNITEHNNVHYLLGFVGDKSYRTKILQFMNATGRSLKKADD